MKQKTLDTGYISSLCMELHLIFQAGIPIDEGVCILRDGEDKPWIGEILTQIYETLLDGYPFYTALEKTGAFPQYMVDMVRVGEETGNLDKGLKSLALYYDRQEQLSKNLRRAVLYPAVLLTMLVAVMVVLIVEVLPMFNDVYGQLGGTMTGMGAVILTFGTMLKAHWIVAVLILLLVIVTAALLFYHGQKSGLRVLLSRKLGLSVATAKLASALSMALHSGLDLDMTMELAEGLTHHPELKAKINACRAQMEEGMPFVETISKEGLFSSLHCRMLGVGMKTGTLDQVMEDMASRCDRSAQESIEGYVGNVEPTLVVIMSILVGLVLLSVMLPLANIMTTLG